jgi:lipopolysaccharide/colanic/teichoic acid biosynthesis glycosyltransferase
VIGVILHEVRAEDPAYAREFEARVRRELAHHLDPEAVAQFSIGLEVHPARPVAEAAAECADWDAHEPPHPREAPKPAYDAIKRALDIAISVALLVILSPLLLLIAALVKLKSAGPVFFKQQRIGSMGKPFRMLKFRTMHMNADHALHHEFVSRFINAGSCGQEAGAAGFFKIANDPRVTSVGRVLRKTSLDELPQLWNVVRGDMSLVGPRPPLPYEVEQYKPWHTRRLIEAKPGITGLWQVGGRSRTTFDDMVRLDLRYARTCSLWTDIKILAATPGAVISGKGAC